MSHVQSHSLVLGHRRRLLERKAMKHTRKASRSFIRSAEKLKKLYRNARGEVSFYSRLAREAFFACTSTLSRKWWGS